MGPSMAHVVAHKMKSARAASLVGIMVLSRWPASGPVSLKLSWVRTCPYAIFRVKTKLSSSQL
ncbi:hypothetical protein L484_014636 [Morus notabilis]|uniref:Uncharacterized protein n=1 Tax=Morus notabilis TaxID=981085 RepID=W9QYI4_9ROSA|nr:hypothetical protein L484_014636 [Morus notabilis]